MSPKNFLFYGSKQASLPSFRGRLGCKSKIPADIMMGLLIYLFDIRITNCKILIINLWQRMI